MWKPEHSVCIAYNQERQRTSLFFSIICAPHASGRHMPDFRELHTSFILSAAWSAAIALHLHLSSSRRLLNPRQCANYIRVTINSIFPDLWHSAFLLPSPSTVVNLRLKCDRFVLLAPLSLELADEHIVRFSFSCVENVTRPTAGI